MKNNKLLLLFLLFILCFPLYSIENNKEKDKLEITIIDYVNDTINFNIKSMVSDTLFISIYIEILNYNNHTITSNSDIFNNSGEFSGTLIIRLNPKEFKEFKIRLTEEDISDINTSYNKKLSKKYQCEKYRLLTKTKLTKTGRNIDTFYSNWVRKM